MSTAIIYLFLTKNSFHEGYFKLAGFLLKPHLFLLRLYIIRNFNTNFAGLK